MAGLFVLLAVAVAAKDWVCDPSNLTFALTFGAVYAAVMALTAVVAIRYFRRKN
jgi:hypothetical protein